MPKSIYSSGSYIAKPIYGDGYLTQCNSFDTCLYKELMINFYNAVSNTLDLIALFPEPVIVRSELITKIPAYAFMNDYTFVRFMWMSANRDKQFDITNISQRFDLKQLYLQYGLKSWINDPVVNTL